MKRINSIASLCLLMFLTLPAYADNKATKLVLQITIDQMRGDYGCHQELDGAWRHDIVIKETRDGREQKLYGKCRFTELFLGKETKDAT